MGGKKKQHKIVKWSLQASWNEIKLLNNSLIKLTVFYFFLIIFINN